MKVWSSGQTETDVNSESDTIEVSGAAKYSDEKLKRYAREAAGDFSYGANMRGSAKYRKHLAEVLIYRAMHEILTKE